MRDLDHIKSHLFDRDYMSGIERDQNRIKATGEVFTPNHAVASMLDALPADFFNNPDKTVIDPACGDGQWLAAVLWRKLSAGHGFQTALESIYGVDLMADNVDECKRRLLCGREDLRDIVDRNIVCANALTYHYRFDGSNPTETEYEYRLRQLGIIPTVRTA